MPNHPDSSPMPLVRSVGTGLLSSITSAIVGTTPLHPFDRALLLAMKHDRAYFMRQNFRRPWHALPQAIAQKSLFGSPAYFFLKDGMTKLVQPALRDDLKLNDTLQKAIIGGLTGGFHGGISSPPMAIKTYTWSEENRHFKTSVKEMYQLGGSAAFFKGMKAVITRDTIHAFVYEGVRHTLRHADLDFFQSDFLCNALAAICSTILASPFNYIRVKQMGTLPQEKEPSWAEIHRTLWASSQHYQQEPLKRFLFISQRLQLMVGIARFALFMPVFQIIYDETKEQLANYFSQTQSSQTVTTSVKASP